METLGLFLVGILFLLSGYKHIRYSEALVDYTKTGFGKCPFASFFGYLGGWPAGLYLVITAIGIVPGETWALYMAVAFLAVTQTLYHRNPGDPADLVHLALLGALLALAT